MKKFLYLITLLIILGGANSVKAETVKLYSTGFASLDQGNGNYEGNNEDGTYKWKGGSYNNYKIFSFDAGTLSNFSTLHFTTSELSGTSSENDDEYRILFMTGDNATKQVYYKNAGEKTITLSSEMTAEQIAGITSIRFAGQSAPPEEPVTWYSVKISASSIYLETSWEEPMQIGTAADWKAFSLLVKNGKPSLNAILTADIEVTDGTMIGIGSNNSGSENPNAYSGTFDGQNYIITYNSPKTTEKVTAPFRFVKDGTIKNLKTAGSMSSTQNIMGGIAGFVQGTVLIDNCSSSMNLSTDDTDSDATIGGILGLQDQSPTSLTVTNCMYTGTLTGDYGVSGIAGYMRNGSGATFTSILYAGSYVTGNASPANMENIVRGGGSLINCYYVSKIGGSTNGTEATSAKLASGEVAYNLQGEQATLYWGQDLKAASSSPMLTNNAAYKVFNVGSGEYANWTNTISDDADWVIFSKLVASGMTDMDVTMTADVNAGKTMVGSEYPGKRYQGTFDGAGHTLTFIFNDATAEKVAPFQAVEGATIKNLKTTGSITSSGNLPAGIAGQIYGTTTIENCSSDMDLSTTATYNGRIGGLVSRCKESGAELYLTNCLFNGTLSTATTGAMISGLIGYSADQKVYLSSCFANPKSITGTGDQRLSHTLTSVSNCWYNSVITTGEKGTEATSAKIASGEVAYDLQNTQATQYWGQDLTDAASSPMLTSDPAYKVFNAGSGEYANWTNTINNDADWVTFSKIVAAGTTDIDVTMTADVNAGSRMVGTSANPYQGTFNGAGHTLTFNYDVSTSNEIAPFQYINNATINNLTTTGSINAQNIFGGIVGTAGGESTLNYCTSNMVLTANHNGETNNGRVAGLVGRCADNSIPVGTSITFNNCMFGGSISSTIDSRCCGLVSWARSTTVIANNCLIAPTNVTNGAENIAATGGTNPIVSTTNCYYTQRFGWSSQGTSATAAQVASGELCYMLNENTVPSTTYFYGQGYLNSSLVENTPSLTSNASKKVYKDTGTDTRYANAGGLLPDPALNNQLSWKFQPSADAACVYMLPTDNTNAFTLYGTSEAYVLRVTAAGATTLILPCNITTLPEGIKAYNLSYDGNTITATPTEGNQITANKPVLINAEAGIYTISTGESYTKTFNFSDLNAAGTTNGALTGVYCTDGIPFNYVPKDAYVLQNGPDGLGFYQVTKENDIKITSFRAYLTAQSNASRLFINYVDNDETSIDEVKGDNGEEGTIYSISGQRVDKATRGLYITNGKKVIIK